VNKSYPRSRRVGDQIQRKLLRREVRDPRLGPITITDVRVSQDLSHAKVFYSVLGGAKDPKLTQEILDDAATMLRGRLGRSLGLRHAPEIHFEADSLIEEGARMSALIRDAVKQDEARHVDDAVDPEA
jgi:ribosome-binding factor A